MAQRSITSYMVRHGILVRAAIVSVVTLIILLAITLPFINNVREMSGKIVSKRKENTELADKVSILSGLDQAVLEERVKILDRALPPKKDVVLYLSTIDGLSRELSLSFGGLSLNPGEVTEASGSAGKTVTKGKPKTEAAGLHSLETEIEITGTKENIYTFLRLVEESAPLMQIKDAKVTGTSETAYALSLKLGMLYATTDIKAVKGPITLFDEKEEQYFQDLSKFRSFSLLSEAAVTDLELGKSNLFESFKLQP